MKKNIVITGASKGIGLNIANLLNNPNYQLILVASELNSFTEKHPGVIYIAANFNDFNAIDTAAKTIHEKVGTIDILINNLGMYIGKSFETTSVNEIQQLMTVNFSGPAYFTQLLLPLLSQGNAPQIINISSIAAKKAAANMAIYTASKMAVSGFSNALRVELNQKGIRVTVLHPSGVNTWNDPNPALLLDPQDIAKTIEFIINTHPKCQIEEMTITAVENK